MPGSAIESSMSRPTSGMASPRPIRSRAQSISSDRPSTVGHYNLMIPPQSVSPEAAFIAPSAASQIVTNDHDSHADTWYDQIGIEPPTETAKVTDAALQLVNGFLDQLLFNFLQVSRATTLAGLRPAVSEVLKPKLAKDTIHNADEELREYLGGADEEDYIQPQGAKASRDWDLELVWKRTRLRCMVYSSLGDLEEEDEDLFMEQENLEIGANEQISDVISPAVAIFLTSVLEYMGELTLTVAGQAAYNRMRAKMEKDLRDGVRDPSEVAERVVVEELDMERVALDRTLGRLWRGWKKRIRAPTTPIDLVSKAFSRSSTGYAKSDYGASDTLSPRMGVGSDAGSEFRKSQELKGDTIVEDVHPADVALPLGDRDIDEIEVPGLVHYSDEENNDDDEDGEVETQNGRFRPKSMLLDPSRIGLGLSMLKKSPAATPPLLRRQRSNSLPLPKAVPLYPSSKALKKGKAENAVEGDQDENDEDLDTTKANTAEHIDALSDEDSAVGSKAKSAISSRKNKVASGIGAAAVVTAAAASGSDSESADDTVYEKAEIMTSSRVSVEGSSSPALSEAGKSLSLKRSSSVHSARIIDVQGPKSPVGSRPVSVEPGERVRPASLSGSGKMVQTSRPEEGRRSRFSEALPGVTVASLSRSPKGRARHSPQPSATISESDEEERANQVSRATEPSKSDKVEDDAVSADSNATKARKLEDGNAIHAVLPNEQMAASGRRKGHSGPRVSAIRTTDISTQPIEERSPDAPRKSPISSSRHVARNDSRGKSSIERSRKDEVEEDLGLPLPQNITSRPTHTSVSSISSGTSRLKPVRTSEENSSSRAESVARNFEELIQSNQTITYTLTPENMRDIDSKRSLDSPVVTKSGRKSEDARSFTHSRVSPTVSEAAPSPTTRRSPGFGRQAIPENEPSKLTGPIPRAPAGIALSTGRMGGPQARDARVPDETTADFAEFIRSTGPPQSPAFRNGNVPSSPAKKSNEIRRVSSASTRSRYQPREAIVESKSENSDLVNFIRQGPPIAASNHRIPRHVAPFRTTMDSDQMNGAAGGKAVDANIPEIRYSQASTNQTDNSMPSMQSSVNSNSALLKNKGSSNLPNKFFDEDDMMPKRKTRRVRDPYAIDFSDEDDEDDFIMTAPKPPPKNEESLAEFLRNYAPPPEPVSQPAKVPKKKSSAPSLINRFRSSTRDSKEAKEAARSINSPVSPRSFAPHESRSLSSRAGTSNGKGYIPIQVNMPPGYDKYGPVDSNPGRPRVVSSASTSNRVPMKKFEPREAVQQRSETADLAAFLRDSAPPPSAPMSRADSFPERPEEAKGLAKVFARRKKSPMV